MADIEQKYVSAERPVNLRTALKDSQRQQPLSPIVRERLAAAKVRSRFGLPLSEQLGGAALKTQPTRITNTAVLGIVIIGVAAVILMLAWIQQSAPFMTGGLLGLLLGVGIVLRESRLKAYIAPSEAKSPLFDQTVVQNFDRLLDKITGEVPESIAVQLGQIKELIARVAQRAGEVNVDENFTMNDRMYLIESVRRYLPDSLQSYLLIPSNQRSAMAIDGKDTAVTVLREQLELIHSELRKCESKITKSSATELLKQRRFLESKRS